MCLVLFRDKWKLRAKLTFMQRYVSVQITKYMCEFLF